jgi:hypothetical protein
MEIDYGPALREKSEHYPKRFEGRTPKTIRMLRTVWPDMPRSRVGPAESGKEYPAWTNSQGAVCAIFPDGERLGVKPHEFEVASWFEADGVTVTRVEPAPEAPAWTGGPMSRERAEEINGAIVRSAGALVIDGERIPLPKCSLEEMLVATRLVSKSEEIDNGDGTRTLMISIRVDPRMIAALYAFEQYDSDPRALLAALGFRLTHGGEGAR